MAMRFDDERDAPQDEPGQTLHLFHSDPGGTGGATPPPTQREPTPPPPPARPQRASAPPPPPANSRHDEDSWGVTSNFDDASSGSHPGATTGRPTQHPTPGSNRTPTGSSDLTLPIYPGQLVSQGKYRLTELLGRGGFAEVWRAEHVELGEPRAIKVLYPQLSQQADFLSRFRREAKMMLKLKDPCAVVVHDYETGHAPFLVMELVDGRTVRDILRDARASSSVTRCGVVPLDLVSRMLFQLCGVMEKARVIKLVHRDLKPENLMLLNGRPVGQEELKVLDFGIAKILKGDDAASDSTYAGNLTNANSMLPLCTPSYASPEQASGTALDHRSDLYTVGVILYELLTGRVPFSAPSGVMGDIPRAMSVLSQQMEKPPLPPSLANPEAKIPPSIDAVILKLLAKSPEERYQSPGELWDAFLSAALVVYPHEDLMPTGTVPTGGSGAGVKTRWPELPEPAVSPGPGIWRRVVMLAAVSAITVTLIMLTGWMIWRGRGGPGEPTVVAKLKNAGYTPSPQAATVDGWPATIVRADGNLYTRVGQGRYLPLGYAASHDAQDAGDGWPDRIERVDANGGTIDPTRQATFVRIPGTTFVMGKNEPGEPWSPAHEVTMTGYYIQQTEVPNREVDAYYRDALKGLGLRDWSIAADQSLGELKIQQVPNAEQEAAELPAVNLSWHEAKAFADWCHGDLPTEAQWELACQSGTPMLSTPYLWGNFPSDPKTTLCRVNKLQEGPVRVDKKFEDQSPRGVIGLAGNVREWCRDTLTSYAGKPATNPCVEPEGFRDGARVIRGSSFVSRDCQPIYAREDPQSPAFAERNGDLGLRVVLEDCPHFILKQVKSNNY